MEKGPLAGKPKFQKYDVIPYPLEVLLKFTLSGPHPLLGDGTNEAVGVVTICMLFVVESTQPCGEVAVSVTV